MAKEDEIKLIAYNIWQQEGCVDGKDCEHWYRAEIIWQEQQKPKDINSETKRQSSPVTKSKTKKKATSAKL